MIVIKLRNYYLEWLEKAGYEQKYEDLLEHNVLDRYYQSQSNVLRVFLKEKGRLTLEEMTAQAENYIEAHKMFSVDKQNKPGNDKKVENKQFQSNNAPKTQQGQEKQNFEKTKKKSVDFRSNDRKPLTCYSYGKLGHKSRDCRKNKTPSQNNSKNENAATCQLIDRHDKDNIS
jgi:hypothetical protein